MKHICFFLLVAVLTACSANHSEEIPITTKDTADVKALVAEEQITTDSSDTAYQKKLQEHISTSADIIRKLRILGITASDSSYCEFYIYSDSRIRAENLSETLKTMEYELITIDSLPLQRDSKLGAYYQLTPVGMPFRVRGLSKKMKMDFSVILNWVKFMHELSYSKGAIFCGWGTTTEELI